MGKGDKKTAKGKRSMGSYGITRKRKTSTRSHAASAALATEGATGDAVKKPAAKKPAAKKPAKKKETTEE